MGFSDELAYQLELDAFAVDVSGECGSSFDVCMRRLTVFRHGCNQNCPDAPMGPSWIGPTLTSHLFDHPVDVRFETPEGAERERGLLVQPYHLDEDLVRSVARFFGVGVVVFDDPPYERAFSTGVVGVLFVPGGRIDALVAALAPRLIRFTEVADSVPSGRR
jgi:hypothetical protein